MFLTATEANSFATTFRTAYSATRFGFLVSREVIGFECRRTWQYLTDRRAIALYRFLFACAVITAVCAAEIGQELWAALNEWVDGVVADSLPADALALPTVEAEIRATVQGYWEAIRVFLGVIGESIGIAIAFLLNEMKQAIAGIMPGLA